VSVPVSDRPNASATCGSSFMNGDGCASLRQRRCRRYQRTAAVSSAMPTMPPTTPPAISPVFDLEPALCDVDVAAVPVDFDVPVAAEDGVPSGESFGNPLRGSRTRKCVG
jgi:hypothetical protein